MLTSETICICSRGYLLQTCPGKFSQRDRDCCTATAVANSLQSTCWAGKAGASKRTSVPLLFGAGNNVEWMTTDFFGEGVNSARFMEEKCNSHGCRYMSGSTLRCEPDLRTGLVRWWVVRFQLKRGTGRWEHGAANRPHPDPLPEGEGELAGYSERTHPVSTALVPRAFEPPLSRGELDLVP